MKFSTLLYRVKQLPKYLQYWAMLGAAELGGLVGVTSIISRLDATVIRADGSVERLGLLSPLVVTNVGVAFLVDDWDNSATDLTTLNYHDSGTGTTAENVADTDLVTPAGPTTRATGTKSQPSANILQTVGTITYTGTLAITEHGLFSQASRAGVGTLWDRSVFSAINVLTGDSIQFTYACTVAAGG